MKLQSHKHTTYCHVEQSYIKKEHAKMTFISLATKVQKQFDLHTRAHIQLTPTV